MNRRDCIECDGSGITQGDGCLTCASARMEEEERERMQETEEYRRGHDDGYEKAVGDILGFIDRECRFTVERAGWLEVEEHIRRGDHVRGDAS